MRAVSNMRSGFPHLRGRVTKHAANLAEILNAEGYGTFCVGKWHLTPMEETSGAGPFEYWPTQSGFDRFYGFLQGETDQFHPELTRDNHHIERPADQDDYHLSEDLVKNACEFINEAINEGYFSFAEMRLIVKAKRNGWKIKKGEISKR